MSLQSGPLFGHGMFLEPSDPPRGASIPEPPTLSVTEHHAQPAPTDHLCTCGRIREACVHDEVRALWHSISEPSPPRPPKS